MPEITDILPTFTFKGLWKFLASTLILLSPLATLFVAVELLGGIPAVLDSLHSGITAATSLIVTTNFGQYYGMANRLFPLNEMMLMWGTLIAVRIVASGIRIIKGWIPTMN